MTWARIASFGTPRLDSSGRVDLPWTKPGDVLPLTLDVDTDDPSQVRAEVWTNTNKNAAPDEYRAVPMQLVSQGSGRAHFETALPVTNVGNYRAAARVSVDGGQSWTWMSQSGIGDLRFRPRDERFDDLAIEEVAVGNVNYDPVTHQTGTFADLMDVGSPDTNGKYTLEWLAKQGVNALWIMPPFEVSKWSQRPASDDAASPYAVKDYFSVRAELSRDAKAVYARGGSAEDARTAALTEMQRFMAKARSLGIQVFLDVALNHVGHEYEFRDLFVAKDSSGNETREVRKNDFSQVAINAGQLSAIQARLNDPAIPDFTDFVAPHMFANKNRDPHGAVSVNDKAPGGWWEWPDTAQLNHGRLRDNGFHWWDDDKAPEQQAVQRYLERILRFWAVDMGVDGFRLDHLTGLPHEILEGALNRVQADVDAHTPAGQTARTLFWFGEDFHTADQTRHFLDAGQGGWFHSFLNAHSAYDIENIISSRWFHDLLSLSSHDEARPLTALGGDQQAAARLQSLLQLLGGPTSRVAGDNLGERTQLPFKQYRGVAALRSASVQGLTMADTIGRAGRARMALTELQDDNRRFLRPSDGRAEYDLLALSRFTDATNGPLSFVVCNMSNTATRSNVFVLDDEAKKRIDPNRLYNVRDVLSDKPNNKLWSAPVLGRDLMSNGLYVQLGPYAVQTLKLEVV